MKPSALRIERLLAKIEAESRARPRRYCFFVSPYNYGVLMPPEGPRPLSRRRTMLPVSRKKFGNRQSNKKRVHPIAVHSQPTADRGLRPS